MKTSLLLMLLTAILAWPAIQTSRAQTVPPTSPSSVGPGSGAAPASPAQSPVQTPPAEKQGSIPAQLSVPESVKFVPAPDAVFWIVFAVMTFVLVFGVSVLGRHLSRDRDWNLADLMSGADGKPSASRMIAFLGFLVMTVIILGIGYSSLWVFLKTGQLPSLSGASAFLLACAGLFAPYFANQIGLAISGPSSMPTTLAPVVAQSSSPAIASPTGVPGVNFGPPVRPIV